jgi:cytochrome c
MKAIHLCLLAAAGVMSAGAVQADEALAKAKNCLACHAVDKKVVGPSYKDVAKKIDQPESPTASGIARRSRLDSQTNHQDSADPDPP